jgi:C4-dicarboxylate-specific signal transduction histidine kinase
MIHEAETERTEARTSHAVRAGLRVLPMAAPDSEQTTLPPPRVTELNARPHVPEEPMTAESAPDAVQKRVLRELAARLLADAWAEAQEIKRQARATAAETRAELAAETEAHRATLAAERARHQAALAQERERHEAALRALSDHRDRVIEEITVLCRGLADAAKRSRTLPHT